MTGPFPRTERSKRDGSASTVRSGACRPSVFSAISFARSASRMSSMPPIVIAVEARSISRSGTASLSCVQHAKDQQARDQQRDPRLNLLRAHQLRQRLRALVGGDVEEQQRLPRELRKIPAEVAEVFREGDQREIPR